MAYETPYNLFPDTFLISSPPILYLAHAASEQQASFLFSQLIDCTFTSGFLFLLFPLLGTLFSQRHPQLAYSPSFPSDLCSTLTPDQRNLSCQHYINELIHPHYSVSSSYVVVGCFLFYYIIFLLSISPSHSPE